MAVDTTTTTTVEHAMTVNGEEVPTSDTFEVINPSTGQSFATVSPPALLRLSCLGHLLPSTCLLHLVHSKDL